ncbi:hypothetical protein SCUCBS95973_007011 [Sporothrix curviconia]|uniref:Phosphodeoxyriboaldolase n=1 Tax=Sporothrix curviconia TaxID=1260050 RepID=A0ABP0CCG2_9PEZI
MGNLEANGTGSAPAISVTLTQLAKMIDHSLLHPTMTDAEILKGLQIAKQYNVATACIKPYVISLVRKELAGSDVRICPVIGFPHGNSTTATKVAEAEEAATLAGNENGVVEIDMVVNVGKVLGGDWDYVIFENDYLAEEHIVRLCQICSDLDVAFVKTSTGYGFVKQADGKLYNYRGATVAHLKLMRQHSKPSVQIKAAGGVRTLDDLLHVMSLGVTRIGATATAAMLDEARQRGITETPTLVTFKPMQE